MSDNQEPSSSSDKNENQDLPVEAEQDPGKPKRKSKRNLGIARSSSEIDLNQKGQDEPQIEEEDHSDDMLADIRRSLQEEDEAKQNKKQKGIFRRVVRAIKPDKTLAKEKSKTRESESDVVDLAPVSDDDSKNINGDTDFVSVRAETAPVAEPDITSSLDAESEIVANPEPEQDIVAEILGLEPGELVTEKSQDELSTQPKLDESNIADVTQNSETLLSHSEKEKGSEDFEAIREVALVDYDDSPLKSQDKPAVSLRQRFKILGRELKPFDLVLIFGAAGLMFIAAIVVLGFSFIRIQNRETAAPVPTEDVPVPFKVTLPGGWEFTLAKGKVEEGKWSPKGAEWLEGTELCRWVALPSSLQLEAVVRTLKPDDPITLTMSNADQLEFKVKSIQNVPVDQIDTLNSKTTCLFLILVNPDKDTRWVVTANP